MKLTNAVSRCLLFGSALILSSSVAIASGGPGAEARRTSSSEPNKPLGKAYWVDPNGKDDNPGTSMKAPFRTITRAMSAAGPGETILIRGGVYHERLRLTKSGIAGFPITFRAYNGEKAIIDPSLETSGWTRCTADDPCLAIGGTVNPNWAHMFVMTSPVSIPALYENGRTLATASWPKSRVRIYRDVKDLFPVVGEGGNFNQNRFLVDSKHLTQPDHYWSGAVLVGRVNSTNNNVGAVPIADFNAAEHKLIFAKPFEIGGATARWTPDHNDAWALVNHPMLLNQPGEWCCMPAAGKFRVYLWPWDANDVPGRIRRYNPDSTVGGDGCIISTNPAQGQHVVFDGLTIRNANSAFLWVNWGGTPPYRGIEVKNCTVEECGGNGIQIGDTVGTRIENCTIRNIGRRAIQLNYANTDVRIVDCNLEYTFESAIIMGGNASRIGVWHNRIGETGCHGNGIATYSNSDCVLIANNRIVTSKIASTLQGDGGSSRINWIGNLFVGGVASISDWGTAGDGTQLFARNCLLNSSGIYGDQKAHKRIVIGNVLQGSGTWSASYHDHNLYISPPKWALNAHERIVTDLSLIFVDPKNGDYRFKPEGPAAELNVNIDEYLTDLKTWFPDFKFDQGFGAWPN